jgi:hypothetical protein
MRLITVTLAAVLLAAALAGPAAAQPRITVEPELLELGVLQQFETRDLKVTIRNDGSDLLEIRDIESTCGCTVPELNTTELAPGAATTMDIHFNSKTFQGKQTKYVHVYSNDPRRPSVDISLTADIKVPLYMEPGKAQIAFPTVPSGESRTVTYTFRTADVPALEITPQTWPKEWLDVKVRPGGKANEAFVDFIVREDAAPGRFREPVTLATNVPAVPRVNLSADVKIVGDVVVTPERVNLRMVRPEQKLSTRVRVAAYRPDTSFTLTGAEVDIPGLRARVENSGSESTVWLDGYALKAGDERIARNGAVSGTLTIRTDLDASPEITVPVMYMVRN